MSKSISQLYATAPASALTGAELLELVQGGVSKGAAYTILRDFLLDNDSTLAANSAVVAATQQAVKAYVAAAVTGLLDFKTATDCSSNPNYPAASKGDAYVVSVIGKIGGASGKSVDVGDVYLAIADNAGGTEASVGTSWIVLEHNLVGALLAANNLSDLANPTTARGNLGGTTLGQALFTLANPSAIRFLRANADNSVSALSDIAFMSALVAPFTWAGKPSAASNTDRIIRITDVGLVAALWYSDGSRWKPVSGSIVLGRTAVQVSHTGDTSEFGAMTVTVPADLLGPSGELEIESQVSYTGSTNTKTTRHRFNGIAGSTALSQGVSTASQITSRYASRISNRGATNSQLLGTNLGAYYGPTTAPLLTSAVDTTAAVDVVISLQLADSSETISLESGLVRAIF